MNSRILPLLALFIAAGIFFVYVGPTWSGSIAATKASIVLDDEALVAADEYKAQQNELASKVNAIDPANLARLSVFLPDSVDNVGLILDLNALAARSSLSLANIDVTANTVDSATPAGQALPASSVNPMGSIDVSLSAVGTYAALKAFLIGVENSARLLDVRNISVSGSETRVYTYKITLRLYWLR